MFISSPPGAAGRSLATVLLHARVWGIDSRGQVGIMCLTSCWVRTEALEVCGDGCPVLHAQMSNVLHQRQALLRRYLHVQVAQHSAQHPSSNHDVYLLHAPAAGHVCSLPVRLVHVCTVSDPHALVHPATLPDWHMGVKHADASVS